MPGPHHGIGDRVFRRELNELDSRVTEVEQNGGGEGGEGGGVTVEGGDLDPHLVQRIRIGAGLTYEPIVDDDGIYACLRSEASTQLEVRGPEGEPDISASAIEVGDGLVVTENEAGVARIEVDPSTPSDPAALGFAVIDTKTLTTPEAIAELEITAGEEDTVLIEADVIGRLAVEGPGEDGPVLRPITLYLKTGGHTLEHVTGVAADDSKALIRISTTELPGTFATDNGDGTWTWTIELFLETAEAFEIVGPGGHLSARIV